MNEEQVISWIFLAVAMASQTGPADFRGISMIADGINHSIPTHKELQSSLSWLTNQGLTSKIGNKYELTSKGRLVYEAASMDSNTVMKIWKQLEQKIKNFA